MKTLKKIGIVLIAIIALLALIGLFLPSAVHIEENAEMNASPEVVYEQIADYNNWPNWSPWHEKDTAMVMTFEGEPMQVGHSYSWKSEDLGDGRMVYTKLDPPTALTSEMFFMGDDKPAYTNFKLEATETGTRAIWSVDFDMGGNPFAKIFGATFFPMMMKKDLKRGLERLKTLTESLPAKTPAVEIKEITTNPMQYVTLSFQGAPSELGTKMGEMYSTLQAYLETEKIAITGPAFAIWHMWSDTLIHFETCMPVGQKIKGNKNIAYAEMAAMPAIQADHYGPSEQTEALHYAMDDYAKAKGLKLGDPLEIYVVDGMTEPDTAKWLTQVIYPILP